MKKEGYYSAGELMKLAHITKKTIRYYDEHHILKPSYVEPNTRTRFYTDDDLARLQQILLFKALGFSLSDIMEMTINESDTHFMVDSLNLQKNWWKTALNSFRSWLGQFRKRHSSSPATRPSTGPKCSTRSTISVWKQA